MAWQWWRRLGSLGFLCLVGCGKEPAPRIEDLAYPVLVLFDKSGGVLHDDAVDLGTMSTQRVVMADEAPYLIDSRLDLYRLRSLRSTHGNAWLMLHPRGRTEVTFELERVSRADVAAARQWIETFDRNLTYAEDREERLERLRDADSLKALLDAVGLSPDPTEE